MSNLNLNTISSLDTKREVDVNRVMQTVDYVGGLVINSRDTIITDGNDRYALTSDTPLPYTTTGAGMPEGGAFVSVGDAVLRQDLANPSKGARLVRGAVIYVNTISDLRALDTSILVDGQQVSMLSYHAPLFPSAQFVGGGMFAWSAGDYSAEVSGDAFSGVYVAPTSDGTGTSGAFVRNATVGRLEYFGARDGDELFDQIQACLNHFNTTIISVSGNIRDEGYGISVPSNRVIQFEGGATLTKTPTTTSAYGIFSVEEKENVVFINPKLVGDRDAHTGTTGEWGMGFNIRSSKNVTIKHADISKFWGDGIYIGETDTGGPCENILITDFEIDHCRRQGISVISVDGLTIRSGKITNTTGTAPSAAIDLEPNFPTQILKNISISDLAMSGNERGLVASLQHLNSGSSDISIHCRNVRCYGTTYAPSFNYGPNNTDSVSGDIVLDDIYSENSHRSGIVCNLSPEIRVSINRPVVKNNERDDAIRITAGDVRIYEPSVYMDTLSAESWRPITAKSETTGNSVIVRNPLHFPRDASGGLRSITVDASFDIAVLDDYRTLTDDMPDSDYLRLDHRKGIILQYSNRKYTTYRNVHFDYVAEGIPITFIVDSSAGEIRLQTASLGGILPDNKYRSGVIVGARKTIEMRDGAIVTTNEIGGWL